jgi:hypothetical protein
MADEGDYSGALYGKRERKTYEARFFFHGAGWGRVHLVRRPVINLLYQPWMVDGDECGAVGGMIFGRGSRSTQRKPVPVPVCPPQIPHDLLWDRTRAAEVGTRRLTAWAEARYYTNYSKKAVFIICNLTDSILWVRFSHRSYDYITGPNKIALCYLKMLSTSLFIKSILQQLKWLMLYTKLTIKIRIRNALHQNAYIHSWRMRHSSSG